MKIMSVYQAHTYGPDGKLPECDYVSRGVRQDHIRLFEAAPRMLAALKLAYPLLTDKAAKEEIGALLNDIAAN